MAEPYQMQRFNSRMQKAHSNYLTNSFNSKMDSSTHLTDDFNMNDGYLLSLLRLIEEYSLLKIHGIGVPIVLIGLPVDMTKQVQMVDHPVVNYVMSAEEKKELVIVGNIVIKDIINKCISI